MPMGVIAATGLTLLISLIVRSDGSLLVAYGSGVIFGIFGVVSAVAVSSSCYRLLTNGALRE
ncbi:hypothetical protein ASF63_18670 [Microbacterium sp. Leaf320]|nr:hypothetical protein ASF63_18670 [Microbacterium sp. Leaf320]